MKEVGRIWQGITKHELEYFKDKSKIDMERYKKEHTSFITEINQLRAKNSKENLQSQQIASSQQNETKNNEAKTPELNKKVSSASTARVGALEVQPRKEISLLQKRHSPAFHNEQTCPSTISRTPMTLQKVYSSYTSPQPLLLQKDESPFSQNKRDLMHRPKKPLSAYIYFS